MRSFTLTAVLASLIAALSGCAANKPIKPQDRAAIEAVAVANAVKMPDAPMVVGSEAGLGILFGVAGSAVGAAESQKAGGNFSTFLEATGIDVAAIVREQFTEQVKRDPFFGPRLSAEATYHYELEVTSYGIVKTNTFSSRWQPILAVRYRLVSPDRKLLAEGSAMTAPFGDLPTFTAEEMKANPQLLRQAFDKAASEVTAKLVQT